MFGLSLPLFVCRSADVFCYLCSFAYSGLQHVLTIEQHSEHLIKDNNYLPMASPLVLEGSSSFYLSVLWCTTTYPWRAPKFWRDPHLFTFLCCGVQLLTHGEPLSFGSSSFYLSVLCFLFVFLLFFLILFIIFLFCRFLCLGPCVVYAQCC
jgi:hypothetical protein